MARSSDKDMRRYIRQWGLQILLIHRVAFILLGIITQSSTHNALNQAASQPNDCCVIRSLNFRHWDAQQQSGSWSEEWIRIHACIWVWNGVCIRSGCISFEDSSFNFVLGPTPSFTTMCVGLWGNSHWIDASELEFVRAVRIFVVMSDRLWVKRPLKWNITTNVHPVVLDPLFQPKQFEAEASVHTSETSQTKTYHTQAMLLKGCAITAVRHHDWTVYCELPVATA